MGTGHGSGTGPSLPYIVSMNLDSQMEELVLHGMKPMNLKSMVLQAEDHIVEVGWQSTPLFEMISRA